MEAKILTTGAENFTEMRTANYYYVDKTLLIRDLLLGQGQGEKKGKGKVTLFTRPRRFGKTFNMSMLKSFFEVAQTDRIGPNEQTKALFEGLAIMDHQELCAAHMGQYPVVFISLKEVHGPTFQDACIALGSALREEAFRLDFLKYSERISEEEKLPFRRLLREEETKNDLIMSLKMLTRLLTRHYGQKVILLIDEYDVPLDKAYQYGYYNEMIDLIRSMFGQALKTNDNLEFAVLTGCLRVAKESIFTGLNNLKVYSITDVQYDEYFGFTDTEVRALLDYYDLQKHYADVKEWYDGYRFGRQEVYCPWDVINYACDILSDSDLEPQAYWLNTSGNAMVRRLIDKAATGTIRLEIEKLLAGQTIQKKLNDKLTHNEIDRDINNVWSLLFMTGYLTLAARPSRGIYELIIPNKEVHQIYEEQVLAWLEDKAMLKAKAALLTDLYAAFAAGDAAAVTEMLNQELLTTISFYDAYETFYHGFLLALLNTCAAWQVTSNPETGHGRSDIIVESTDGKLGLVIEVKHVKDTAAVAQKLPDAAEMPVEPKLPVEQKPQDEPKLTVDQKPQDEPKLTVDQKLQASSKKALRQILDNDYAAALREAQLPTIWLYGIAFHKKQCLVAARRLT